MTPSSRKEVKIAPIRGEDLDQLGHAAARKIDFFFPDSKQTNHASAANTPIIFLHLLAREQFGRAVAMSWSIDPVVVERVSLNWAVIEVGRGCGASTHRPVDGEPCGTSDGNKTRSGAA